MPQIKFKGKSVIANYHLTAPYCELKPSRKLSLLAAGANVSRHDNLIIHGDNLLALKALMPDYAGRVNCVYIDPPYNTGNEGWCYNDRVNNPMMRAWLHNAVDAEDLTRHDKWLCMMFPRLSLLSELLAEDGVIFVSIDDNEQHRLRMMMDEIFGEENFVNSLVWINKIEGRQIIRSGAAGTHENILVYAKNMEKLPVWNSIHAKKANALMPTAYKERKHEILRDDIGEYVIKHELHNINRVFNEETRKNLVFAIHYNPKTGKVKFSDAGGKTEYPGFVKIPPKAIPDGKHKFYAWRWSREKILADINNLHFEKHNGFYRVWTKIRDFEVTNFKDLITNITNGGKLLKGMGMDFPNPKPTALLKLLIETAVDKNAIVLDSFAGSGTTAHAVLELNKADGGNRQFILVECEKYADNITAERVRRVIKGIPTSKNETLQKGLGGSFSFFALGDEIEMDAILEQDKLPPYEELARYVFYTATGEQWNEKKLNRKTNYIGDSRRYDVFLFYNPSVDYLKTTALTLETAKKLPRPKGKTRLVYAPACYATDDSLDALRIKYCQLPFQIHKMEAGE